MTRFRLRPLPTAEELAKIYAVPHNSSRFPDHAVRVNMTVALGESIMLDEKSLIVDLSAGDGLIGRALAGHTGAMLILGDYAEGYALHGPIEKTLIQLEELLDGAKVDLFICSETLEHLDDPDYVLAHIRRISHGLLMSTPDGEKDDSNPEHVWSWETADIREMLEVTGWKPMICNSLDLRYAGFLYCFQIWLAE